MTVDSLVASTHLLTLRRAEIRTAGNVPTHVASDQASGPVDMTRRFGSTQRLWKFGGLVQKGEQLAVSRSPPLRRGSDSHSLKMESLEALDGGGGTFARFSSFFHYFLHSIIVAGSRQVSVVFVVEQGHV